MSSTSLGERERRISAEPLRLVGQRPGFFRGTAASWRDIWGRRELLGLLVRRELTARYKDSSLGIVWSLVRPLAQLLIYYFAIGALLGAARVIPDFAIFVFVGLTSWTLFTETLSVATTSIVNNAGIVKKVYLPREVFPLSAVGSGLFNFGVQFVILLAATIVFGRFPWSPDLVFAPLSIAVLVVWGTALGMLLAALDVYFRDVEHIIEVMLVILFWASPIVYSFTYVRNALDGSWIESVYLGNPVTIAVIGMQKALWLSGSTATGNLAQVFPDDLALRLWVTLAAGIVAIWLAQRIFARLQRDFAQEL